MTYWMLFLCGINHYVELVIRGSPFKVRAELVKRHGKAILLNWKNIKHNGEDKSYEKIELS